MRIPRNVRQYSQKLLAYLRPLTQNISTIPPRITKSQPIHILVYEMKGMCAYVSPSSFARLTAVIPASINAPRTPHFSSVAKPLAVVFDSQDEALRGIAGGEVKSGDVVVIRYEGPKKRGGAYRTY